ncbi:MAG: hypothetical protein JRJ39_00155 [Deltaproteobacteria bacterium]|nr:hypothetical protein [Deltaproteobacteria bacterium]
MREIDGEMVCDKCYENSGGIKLMKEWIKVLGRVACKPESEYLTWFIKLNNDTRDFIEKYERS